MRYRIDPSAPVGAEIRRVATGLLDTAVAPLRQGHPPSAADLALAAGALDDARSLLRLARGGVDGPARKAALAVVAEARAAVEAAAPSPLGPTFELAAARATGTITDDALHRIRLVVTEPAPLWAPPHATAAPAPPVGYGAEAAPALAPPPSPWEGVADDLDAALLAASLWPSPAVGGFAALSAGLAKDYRRGRDALASVAGDRSLEATATFAARTRDHHRHLRLLRPVWPRMMKLLVGEARTLAELAEHQHQLGVLRTVLLAQGDRQLRRDGHALVGVLDEDRLDLGERITALGARIYADEPAALVERFTSWWSVATA